MKEPQRELFKDVKVCPICNEKFGLKLNSKICNRCGKVTIIAVTIIVILPIHVTRTRRYSVQSVANRRPILNIRRKMAKCANQLLCRI